MELYLRYLGMQTSPPACLCHAVNGMLGARMMREGTNLHMRVSQWLSTRLGGVYKKNNSEGSPLSLFFIDNY